MIINYIKSWLKGINVQDLSQHRVYTHRYEDLCM